ncbi:hypothetical protein [Arthrobacter castelli]|uniref:hypothetical protein n=1 Tax=Arthrobacter castelli TaxID=271431 RepID=UPI0003FFE82C
MKRYAALIVLPLALVVTGCSQVEEAATDAANDAVSDASSAAEDAVNDAASDLATAAVGEVVQRICEPLQDGTVSAEDQQFLGGLVSAAESAGVSNEIIAPMEEIAQAGDNVPAESVEALQQSCDAKTGK